MESERRTHPAGALAWPLYALTIGLVVVAAEIVAIGGILDLSPLLLIPLPFLLGFFAPKRWLAVTLVAAVFVASLVFYAVSPPVPEPRDCPECIHHETGLPELGVVMAGILWTGATGIGVGLGRLVQWIRGGGLRPLAEEAAQAGQP